MKAKTSAAAIVGVGAGSVADRRQTHGSYGREGRKDGKSVEVLCDCAKRVRAALDRQVDSIR